jgi:methyl halide transferase
MHRLPDWHTKYRRFSINPQDTLGKRKAASYYSRGLHLDAPCFYPIQFQDALSMLDLNFWQGRYETGDTPWDLGGPSSHLVELLSRKPDFLKPGKMAVFGAGRGHDAALFAQSGLEVVGFDYAPGAVESARQQYGNLLAFEQADIFSLADPADPRAGQFDYILEHTCFCAIHPRERELYRASVLNLLKPGGYLIGIFWEHSDPDGPPYSTTLADLAQYFGLEFTTMLNEEKKPVSDREGVERLVVLRRKTEL